jgi:hypothetical protein
MKLSILVAACFVIVGGAALGLTTFGARGQSQAINSTPENSQVEAARAAYEAELRAALDLRSGVTRGSRAE